MAVKGAKSGAAPRLLPAKLTITFRVSTTSVSPAFDEAALVARAKAGDQDAFSELVTHYDRRVFRMAKQITENDDDAEDVLQETFLKAYTHLNDFQGNSKFYTWLVRIAVNEALMKLRKRRSDKTVPLDEPIDTGEDEVVREIAVWDQNPEDVYSREELATTRSGRTKFKSSLSHRFHLERHRRAVDRRDAEMLGIVNLSGKESASSSPAAASGEVDPAIQEKGRRRICLLVSNF